MATKQTVMWTALPNGVRTDKDRKQWLLLSAFMSPRLESTVTPLWLAAFPDFITEDPAVNWASTVNAMTFSVQFQRRTGTVLTVPAAALRRTSTADPLLFSRLFSPETPVKGYIAPDLSQLLANIKSFSMRRSATALRDHISAVASLPEDVYRIPKPEELINPAIFPNSPLTEHLAPQMQAAGLPVRAAAAAAEPTIFESYTEFHQPFRDVIPSPAERAARDAIERETDFHKAITALGNYPVLLPLLGLVVNLEVPLGPALLAEIATARKVRLVPTWPNAGDPSVQRLPAAPPEHPWTAIEARGRTTVSGFQVTAFRPKAKEGELSNGYLVVRDTSTDGANDPAVLQNIDVDLALGRMFASFDSILQMIRTRVFPEPVVIESLEGEPQVQAAEIDPDTFIDEIRAGFPTLGQPTMAMSIHGAGERLGKRLTATSTKNALLAANKHTDITHYAEELCRGYRVDVWDSVTKVWHPLCRRLGTYTLGDTVLTQGDITEIMDEGWVQLAPTSSPDDDPQAPTEMRLHEQLFTWNGWSLVVERPGAALAERDPIEGEEDPYAYRPNIMRRTWVDPLDPTATERPLGEYENPNLPLTTRFRVPPGTLPRLRLGTTYRFRARWVDLAGHSVPFEAGAPTDTPGGAADSTTTVTRAITHKRYEPIKPPTVVIDKELRRGETPLHCVITSNYNTAPVETTERHICPPRTSFTMAEAHGAFDLDTAGKPMDGSAVTHALIAARDAWDFPHNPKPTDDPPGDGKQAPISTTIGSIPTPLPYLADVPSRGASFTGLPGQGTSLAKVTYAGRTPLLNSTTVKISDVLSEESSALRIPFEVDTAEGVDRRPLKLVVKGIEGTDIRLTSHDTPAAPSWSASKRELTVELAKAEQVTVELSSFANAADMSLFGTYQWGVTKSIQDLKPILLASTISAEALSPAVMTPKAVALPLLSRTDLPIKTNTLIDVSVLGNNWTVTPADTLTLVHAVRQPMIAPRLTTFLRAVRGPGATNATLVDWVQIHGKSTARLVMNGYWKEPVDDGPGKDMPLWGDTAAERKGQAFDIVVHPEETVALSLAMAPPEGLIMPVPPVNKSRDQRRQRHAFGDTKHRYIKYQLTAASRFQHYFPADATTTRVGNTRWIHVPSTARPLAPEVDLVLPAFKWTNTDGGLTASSFRGGGRLRVYLKRPWFTSGAGERLAVLLWHPSNNISSFDKISRYVTEWGDDPVFASAGSVPTSLPRPEDFLDYSARRYGLVPAEYTGSENLRVNAVLYDPQFDEETDRWFVDITMKPGNAYFPFVKLALARYQQYALENLNLSTTVTVDAVQLTPDRAATVSWAFDGGTFNVTVNGKSYKKTAAGYGPLMTLSIERRAADGFAWVPISIWGQTEVAMSTYTPPKLMYGDTRTYWGHTVQAKGLDLTGEVRLVIREYERHRTGAPVASESLGTRPVYIGVLPLHGPQM